MSRLGAGLHGSLTRSLYYTNFAAYFFRYCIRRAGFLEKIKGVKPERRHTTHAQSEPETP